MVSFLLSVLVLTVVSCNSDSGEQKKESVDSTSVQIKTLTKQTQQDSIRAKGLKILTALKEGNYSLLSKYFSRSGVYFSPYGFLDTTNCKKLSATDLLKSIEKKWILTWGSFDGTGDPIKLTTKAFLKKFVYNKDYSQAKDVGYDTILHKGNSLINIDQVFPGQHFLDYHFKGFEKRYEGMDWTSLILVFSKEEDEYYLKGVIHHQWTI